MLTLDKIKLYRRFNGDIDGFARSGTNVRLDMTDEDWFLIDELRQALFLVASGQAAPEYVAKTEQKLAQLTADELTRAALRDLALG